MRLLQAAQHLPHDGERFVVGSRVHDARIKLGVNRLPVEAPGILLPVLIANGRPDFLKGSDLALLVRERIGPHKGLPQKGRKLTNTDQSLCHPGGIWWRQALACVFQKNLISPIGCFPHLAGCDIDSSRSGCKSNPRQSPATRLRPRPANWFPKSRVPDPPSTRTYRHPGW